MTATKANASVGKTRDHLCGVRIPHAIFGLRSAENNAAMHNEQRNRHTKIELYVCNMSPVVKECHC